MTIVLPLRTRRVRRQRAPSAAPPPPDAVPRVARMVALAHRWRSLIRSGVVEDQAALAALVGVSRARVTQVMDLLHLAPDIQEALLDLPGVVRGRDGRRERDLRAIAAELHWPRQREMASTLLARRAGGRRPNRPVETPRRVLRTAGGGAFIGL